jgi:hypothetical protein
VAFLPLHLEQALQSSTLLKGLYGIAQRVVGRYERPYLVVAIDPVNFEKPYTEDLEGVSTVLKSTPPGPRREKRLTPGYPAITAAIVNLPDGRCRIAVITYANWFSYRTDDFVSQNREIYRAIRTTRALFAQTPLRFVGDAGLDDQKIFSQVARVNGQFIFRVSHDNRLVEVFNERLQRWEPQEHLADLAASVPWSVHLRNRLSARPYQATRDREPGLVTAAPTLQPTEPSGPWSPTIPIGNASLSCSPISRSPTPKTPKPCIPNGATGPRSSIPTALIRSKGWMLRICASTLSNACAASLSLSCWRPSSSTTLTRLGRRQPSSGCAVSGVNSVAQLTPMAPTSSWQVSALSWSLLLPSSSLVTIHSPEPRRLMGNHQGKNGKLG